LVQLSRVVSPPRKYILFVTANDLINRARKPAFDVEVDPAQSIDQKIPKKISAGGTIFRFYPVIGLQHFGRIATGNESFDGIVIIKSMAPAWIRLNKKFDVALKGNGKLKIGIGLVNYSGNPGFGRNLGQKPFPRI
jgi:hypothetical protein